MIENINRRFFESQLMILKYCGLWNPYQAMNCSQSKKNSSKSYAVFSICILTIFFYFFLLTELLYLVSPNDQKDVSDAFFVSVTGYKMAIKIHYFLRQRREYRVVVNEFQYSIDLRPRNVDEAKLFQKALKTSSAFFKTFYFFAYGAVSFWGVVPIYNYFNGYPLSLPVPAWFPYADTYLHLFWIAFAYQMVGAFIIANMTVALCSFEFTCFVYLNACIQTLSIRLTQVGKHTAKSISRTPHGYSKPYEDIVHLVKYHLWVKRYVRHCEKLTQATIFAEILFSSLIICVTSFKIVTGAGNGVEMISTVSYLGAMLIQIYQFCFVGNEITYSSNKLSENAFISNVHSFDASTKQLFLIMMQQLQREINISAGSIFKIKMSIDTFLKVIKTSYSYMAVLQAMEK